MPREVLRKKQEDFIAIRLALASPEEMLKWSHGEVTKPETINYRTLKPEKEGLFDERIFGPVRDYECACGKYKKIRYKGIVCDKCGVEVTRSSVRRERMGHIALAVPVSHIWYLRGVPSVLSLTLDVPARQLEQVIYFAAYIITRVDEEAQRKALTELDASFAQQIKKLATAFQGKSTSEERAERRKKEEQLKLAYAVAKEQLASLRIKKIVSELEYQDLALKYGHVFQAGIGAEAVYELVRSLDLPATIKALKADLTKAIGQRRRRIQKRLYLLEGFVKANIKPEWMFLTILPVIPPDLRPMVQLEGGRFASSDLNDLYRRVINRNNRLKKLITIGAPEVITRNEKRILQEAVDALIDIGARETAASTASIRRKPKSLSDLLRGKQGRFRQNLLGKRVDYSGRSVIVVGPQLLLHQCGIPKPIALELFKPFVIGRLRDGVVHNVKTAGKLVEKQTPEVWDALDEVIQHYKVLLNRAPTLHRLGIQAFQPVLVEGNAIQLHPLVCAAFNADFDGDQMAIHLPLSRKAQEEAEEIMISTRNLLKPATGEAIVFPSLDMVLGCHYLTLLRPTPAGERTPAFRDINEAYLAHGNGKIHYHTEILVPVEGELIRTTLGRLIFNSILPSGVPLINSVVGKKELRRLIESIYHQLGQEAVVAFVDRLKELGFRYATLSGATVSIGDLEMPPERNRIIKETDQKVEEIRRQYKEGFITVDERRRLVTQLWTEAKEKIEEMIVAKKDIFNPVYMMVSSGARGSVEQLNQLIGMKGLVVNPAQQIIELPVRSNYTEGLSSLEYFLSTHGARKGGVDTALRTSDAGYLTRRLIDVAQDVVVTEEDCGVGAGMVISRATADLLGESFRARIWGRFLAKDVVDAQGRKLARKGTYLTDQIAQLIDESGVAEVEIFSPLECQALRGVCRKCYGADLATARPIELGEAVGIVAAQSVGEPGTQLTMRTFHTGGVASAQDITQGLPRVEELFEARSPKTEAILAEQDGVVKILETDGRLIVRLESILPTHSQWTVPAGAQLVVRDGQAVKKGQILFKQGEKAVTAPGNGPIELKGNKLTVFYHKRETREYPVGSRANLRVEDGAKVHKGEALTEGHINPHDLMRLKGIKATRDYIIEEIKRIYILEGQNINDRHLEILVRQMFSKARIKESGDSRLVPGEIVDYLKAKKISEDLKKKGKTPPLFERLLLGVTKVALSTESFLSAASFQETTSVLVKAATQGKIDYLRGLKENVIIGRLIPAGTGFREK